MKKLRFVESAVAGILGAFGDSTAKAVWDENEKTLTFYYKAFSGCGNLANEVNFPSSSDDRAEHGVDDTASVTNFSYQGNNKPKEKKNEYIDARACVHVAADRAR